MSYTKERQHEYYLANKWRWNTPNQEEAKKKWRKENKQKLSAQKKLKYQNASEEEIEKRKKDGKEYHKKNYIKKPRVLLTEEEKKEKIRIYNAARRKNFTKEQREEDNKKRQERKRKWRKENPEKAKLSKQREHLRLKYGMTIEDKNRMIDIQGGSCANSFCDIIFSGDSYQTIPCVDHDHKTGKVREILCHWCNKNLGILENLLFHSLSIIVPEKIRTKEENRWAGLMIYLEQHTESLNE
jgi:hypothetical protein